ncbi:MAG: glycoside hydrolase family 3 C-terminal domain-containing protein [Candidatus Lokiarchaeota archaeon]|nr:glycoside hydrolase family 3 C-terminal domain-containing protein [Candidatus Lokiarchaeota archaeon]
MSEEKSKDELLKLAFMNSNLDIEERVVDLLNRLTLHEKFSLMSGKRWWYTKPIERLGIKSFAMHDGPHGVRVDNKGEIQSTYFPSGICRAATWNPELSHKFGVAIAEEIREVGAHMLLAPGINIQRTPMCGRTFEYQTEDPFLNKILTVETVKGIQSQRIAACVKHFICNNQETNRFTVNSEVSERALQEIYYPAFKAAIQEADAWSIMSCYNKVNGTYGSEHEHLLREVLMNEWGFRGFVVSDWGATRTSTSTESLMNAGLTLEMPTENKYVPSILEKALDKNKFTEEILNDNIKRLLRVMLLVGLFDDYSTLPKGSRNTSDHQNLARRIAEEGMVLLKNEKNILPLNMEKTKKIALLGPMLNKRTYLEGGSSTNFPPYEIKPLEGLTEKCNGKIEIVDSPSEADVTLIIAGLRHKRGMDVEGEDRKAFKLPTSQIELITSTVEENPNTILILTGTPVSMHEWIEKVPAVIQLWYAGMEAGHALSGIIFGDINPSGKLPITFPKKLSDSPAHVSERTYPGDQNVFYDEGIYVGYRHFDTKGIEPLFPFGHGLSYTNFTYENLKFSNKKISGDESLTISLNVLNSGDYEGAEVVQLYIQDVKSSVERPLKELKGFKKINLKPNEKSTVSFDLSKDDLSYYNENLQNWIAEKGEFNVLIGSSSRDIRLQGNFEYIG